MRLAALGALAALLTAPLAAQAAQQPARFAVTLQGKVVDAVSYDRTIVGDDCIIQRTGAGGRELAIRSLRPTTIEVARSASRVVYRPARVASLRVAATTLPGSYTEIRRCRFLPPEKLVVDCRAAATTVSRLRANFRSGRNAILFRRPAPVRRDVTACGLGVSVPGGWLHEFPGRIDQNALLAGRSLRVIARASGMRRRTDDGDPAFQRTQRTTVRWTLTFRRLP
jgi:hypothetical protein